MRTAEKGGSSPQQQQQQQQQQKPHNLQGPSEPHEQGPEERARQSSSDTAEPPDTPGSSHMVEPSAPQQPPPSYDDVVFSDHSASDQLGASGTNGAVMPHPEATESEPLITDQEQPQQQQQQREARPDASSISSHDFFARLKYKHSSKGCSSSDAWLNTDVKALRRFIVECNSEKPRVSIEVVGSHTKEKIVESFTTDANGQRQRHTNTCRETVTDFKFVMELTPYIHDKGSLYTARAPNGEPLDVDGILEDYVRADNFLKEIVVQKKVIWDYDLARREIITFIRNTGYPHNVEVRFPMENDRVAVRSHNTAAQVWRHPVTSFLCFITCLCVVGWPMRYLAAKKWRDKVMSDFVVLASPRDFVERNSLFIRNQVSWSFWPDQQTMPFPMPMHYDAASTS
ncbi:hypothetical protein LPJ56_001130 [Coemansia sp. RSA 2599]|nr:hypothetical protein LPJ75_000679 [Coemansia sp. RSA 2598]KAJ1828409.1 hypothetical protein LPJ56_001130 [Coemansia sp. RSA 2599]